MPRLSPLAPVLEDCGRWERKLFSMIWLHIFTSFIFLDEECLYVSFHFPGRFLITQNHLGLKNAYFIHCVALDSKAIINPAGWLPNLSGQKQLFLTTSGMSAHIWDQSSRGRCAWRVVTDSLAPSQSLTSNIQCCPPFNKSPYKHQKQNFRNTKYSQQKSFAHVKHVFDLALQNCNLLFRQKVWVWI